MLFNEVDESKTFSILKVNQPVILATLEHARLPVGIYKIQGSISNRFRGVRERRLIAAGVISIEVVYPCKHFKSVCADTFDEPKIPATLEPDMTAGSFFEDQTALDGIKKELPPPRVTSIVDGVDANEEASRGTPRAGVRRRLSKPKEIKVKTELPEAFPRQL